MKFVSIHCTAYKLSIVVCGIVYAKARKKSTFSKTEDIRKFNFFVRALNI
jgi:hypothetical protein